MESAPRRRWKLIAALVLVVALYWLAMFVATHVPIRPTPEVDPYSLDKLEHLAAFAALAALLCAVGAACGFRSWKLTAGIVGVVALYGVLDETTQALVSHRTPEFLDWIADVVGTGLGIALYSLVDPFRVATCEPRPPAV